MKAFCLAILLIGGCGSPQKYPLPDLAQIAKTLSYAAVVKDPENPLHRVEVHPIEGEMELYVAIRDWQEHWWGDFIVFQFKDGRINWTAALPEEPDEQSILRVKGFRLSGFARPFVEVFGITHMGNGNYYLYELCGRELRLVLKSHAVDRHWADNNLIRGDHLDPTYLDLNGDGYLDVELTGVVEQFSRDPEVDPNRYFQSTPCRKVFHWNSTLNRFIEDKSQRKGFDCYGGAED